MNTINNILRAYHTNTIELTKHSDDYVTAAVQKHDDMYYFITVEPNGYYNCSTISKELFDLLVKELS